jgi:hypothetical protein
VAAPQQSDYTTLWRGRPEKEELPLDNPLPHRAVDRLRKLFHAIPERFMFGQ